MNPKQELTDMTICRAVFALWVFTYHVDLYLNFSRFLGPAADLIRHGYLGVDGFFILSGLILARTHPELAGGGQRFYAKRRTPQFQPPAGGLVRRFYGKRLARIYPVHLASIIVLAVLVCVGRLRGWEPHDPSRFDVSSLLQNLTLLQGWGGAPMELGITRPGRSAPNGLAIWCFRFSGICLPISTRSSLCKFWWPGLP